MQLKKSDYSVQIKVMHGWKQFYYAVTYYFQSAQKSTSPFARIEDWNGGRHDMAISVIMWNPQFSFISRPQTNMKYH